LKPKGKNNLLVSVPAHRQDVKIEADLIEEMARIYGYERIPASIPKVSPDFTIAGRGSLVSLTKNILAGLGLNEVITYSLMERGLAKEFVAEPLGILNPLSSQQDVLRPTLIPGLLKCTAANLNQKQPFINIFEIADIFTGAVENPKEELSLGIAISGVKNTLVADYGAVKEEAGFLHLKGVLETLFSRLGIKNYSFVAGASASGFSVCIGKDLVAKLNKVAAATLDNFNVKNKNVFTAEVALERLLPLVKLEKKFSALPLYPAIVRDISFILKENIRVDDILRAVRERGGSLLEEARIVDYYKGSQIPAGFRGLTVSCIYRSQERTLTEAEINPVHSLVMAVLKDRFAAELR
jgi:phenylalanyl-tRNA synthetase beta chain